MKLPVTFRSLGDPITIEERDLDGPLGYWDEGAATIALDAAQPDAGKLVALLHEAMHVVESMMIQNGAIKRHVSHDFITGSAFAIATILVHAGAIEGVNAHDWKRFVRMLDAQNGAP